MSAKWVEEIRADERARMADEKVREQAQYERERASGHVPWRCWAHVQTELERSVRVGERLGLSREPNVVISDSKACADVTRGQFDNILARLQAQGIKANGKMDCHDMDGFYVGDRIWIDN